MDFIEKLTSAVQKNRSLLCVGLDPDPSMIPDDRVVVFNQRLIEATIDLACAYKPNLALYEAMGMEGLSALEQTLDTIRQANPNIPIIGDAKRADIGNCSLAYSHSLFERYKFDAVTVNPYMGSDALAPFLERKDKGVFILCHTSNPGALEIQELMVLQRGNATARPLYEIVAELAQKWNTNGNVGLVVGATYPEQILRIRQICPNMLFLIPGVGPQGGNLAKTVSSAVDTQGAGFIISVSRQIMYATRTSRGLQSTPTEAVKKMRSVARHLRNEINSHLPIPLEKTQRRVHHGNGGKVERRCSPEEEAPLWVAATTGR